MGCDGDSIMPHNTLSRPILVVQPGKTQDSSQLLFASGEFTFPTSESGFPGRQRLFSTCDICLASSHFTLATRKCRRGGYRLLLWMLTPISQPTSRHFLADSSLLEKLLLVILDEITQHHIHLANECDGNIAYHFVGASGQNAIIVLAVAVFTAAFAGVIVTLVACPPQFQLMVGQVILIVL